jgi:hypothetical protein
VQSSGGDRTVEGADVLVAMYSERDSFAVYLLKRHQINRLTLTQYSLMEHVKKIFKLKKKLKILKVMLLHLQMQAL